LDPTQNDGQQGFSDFLTLATLGTQTFLANQAITSPRPSTYALNGQGQMIATGGGAPAVSFLSGGGGSFVWIIVIVFVLFLFLGRRH
jgi:hypothetical protein